MQTLFGPFAAPARRAAQRGMTLVELMVAVTLALLVTLAAMGVLLFARQGSSAMEQSVALRDNARFSAELIRRIVQQTGFESFNLNSVTREGVSGWVTASAVPDIEGRNNAMVTAGSNPTGVSSGSRPTACGTVVDTSCLNGSDVLILRYQGASMTDSSGALIADGSIINCAGVPVPDVSTAANRPMSAFHVRRSAAGEPALVCTYLDASGNVVDRELIEGVETFQVLYGVDGVTPGTGTTSTADATLIQRYLRADQMTVAGDAAATQNNWRRVRAVRIGLVLRGPVGSAVDASATQTFYPLGAKMVSTDDLGSTWVAPADGRLRQELTFTVHLRNYIGQGV